MPRIGEIGPLCASVRFACAMLVLTLVCSAVGIIVATLPAAPLASAGARVPSAPIPVHPVTGGAARFFPGSAPSLDRIAAAVDAAESDYGTNPRMMRADRNGPQGPMQISAAAAADIGGGNRFDLNENLALGRAYLATMYRRYGSWADAVAAYNWGPGRMDAWVHQGRRADRLPAAVARYTGQVLLASASPGVQLPDPNVKALSLTWGPHRKAREASRREGVAGAEGPSIPAGAGNIGKAAAPARLSPRGHRKHSKDAVARAHTSSARLARTRPRRGAARVAPGSLSARRGHAKMRTASRERLAVHSGERRS
ncbi:MAG TPA: lytic transglycosylase domain-containing protein [Stellaceae bacterium]|nr:lytic transglycosylase domain-containing protein [Stellaceae bacterium]